MLEQQTKSKSIAATEEQKLKQHFAAPLAESDKCSGRHLTKEATASFFEPREGAVTTAASMVAAIKTPTSATTPTTAAAMTTDESKNILTAEFFHNGVTNLAQDPKFVDAGKSSRTPLPMLAFAKTAVDEMLRQKDVPVHTHFEGLTITVPALCQKSMQPEHHSAVAQKLLHVDWCNVHGLNAQCPHCQVGILKNDRTNFSKNRLLFPMFI